MATDAAISAAVPPTTLRRVIVAATIGNVLEWFDFVVYGFLAVTIAEVFFPDRQPDRVAADHLRRVRPRLSRAAAGGDRHRRLYRPRGRKAGLTLSIALMMVGTTLMAMTPSYATIGIAAPIILTLARLLQGFSVGGEFGSSVAFLAEHGGGRRGFAASWQFPPAA